MLRWALKSVFMEWVLARHELCFYCDNDLYFYHDYEFLWEQLSGLSVLLSPHWRTIEPNLDDPIIKRNIELTYMHGLYNAGFIGVSRAGIDFLQWWSRCCLGYPHFRNNQAMRDDQSFLNVVPLNFDDVGIIEQRGCNISAWNMHVNRRSLDAQGNVIINERDALVFVHFASGYEQTFERGDDVLLATYWGKWKERLRHWSAFSEPFVVEVRISLVRRIQQGLAWRFWSLIDGILSGMGLQRKGVF
jgi:hypothetical protein